jgi:diacylglycerol kinase family enzyme
MLKGLLGYRNQAVRIQIDDVYDQVLNVTTAAICNGQYFGGGMRIAPKAKPDDGMFDVIVLNDVSVFGLMKGLGSVYRGEHLANIHVMALRGRKITATPVEEGAEVLLDIDGEAPGRLPATFEILPNAVYLRS